jgi:ubiquinol-cytochrome c reductase iron-sulfur subunit
MAAIRPINNDRRTWIAATSAAGGAGLVAVATPFVASLTPSAKARAQGGPVEVPLQSIRLGEIQTVEWRGKPVFVLRRSQDMINALAGHDDLLADPRSKRTNEPDYAKNAGRSTKPELAVLVAVCTHLGCIPTYRPEPNAPDLGSSWPGGFYCPCHGSKFDLAGRVFKNVPAPTNLEVPPYSFASETTLLIGVDPRA